MFIFTAKLNRKKLILGAAAVVLLCGAAAVAAGLSGSERAAAASVAVSPKNVHTQEDRVAYLEHYGWAVDTTSCTVEELLIPKEFDDTYTQYLALQTAQGFDLQKYRGKRVKRYAYTITNYPTGEAGVQVGLLIYRDTVVGGEILSVQPDGFIHGLAMPK